MSTLATIDLLLRGAALPPLLACAWLLATAPRRDHLRGIGAALALSVAAFVLSSSAPIARALGPAAWLLTPLCVAKPVLFWLFARALFSDRFTLRAPHVAALVAAVLAGTWHEAWYRAAAWQGVATNGAHAAAALYQAAILAAVGGALAGVLRDRAADPLQPRRRLRGRFVAAASVYMATVVGVQLMLLLRGGATPGALVVANSAVIAVAAIGACAALASRRRIDALLGAPRPAPDDPALKRLREHLQRMPGWYRRPGLTVRALADELGLHEYQLRRAVTHGLGQPNFNRFVNGHRIDEACRRLRSEPETAVLTIALDVGFASLGPFNREFKARVGSTPTEYRRAGSPIPQSAGAAAEAARPHAAG